MGNCNCDSNKETFDPQDLVNDNIHKRDRSEDVVLARANIKRNQTKEDNSNIIVFEEFKNYLATNNIVLIDEDSLMLNIEEYDEKVIKKYKELNSFIDNISSNNTIDNDENELYYFGVVKLSDDTIYNGTWNKKFQKHGKGAIKDENGIYIGDFTKDYVTGKGLYINKFKNIYIGEFVNRIAEGLGEVYLNDSQNYYFKGNFKDNKMNGFGFEKLEDGSTFEGEFENGLKKKGKFVFSNGCIYDGEFVGNKFENFGIYYWPDGRKYEGNFLNNQIHGKGKFTFSDGRVYEGEYKNGVKDGKGKVIYPDNNVYYGEWTNDLQHGHFSKINSDNTKEKSFWRFGKKIKNI